MLKRFDKQKKAMQLDQLKNFDIQYENANDTKFIMHRFGAYVVFFFAIILMCIPGKYIMQVHGAYKFAVGLFMLLNIGIFSMINLYFYYTDQTDKLKSIYEIMMNYPINPKFIFYSRLRYLLKYVTVLSLIFLLLQLLIGLTSHKLGGTLVFYVVGMMGVSFLLQALLHTCFYLFRNK